MVKSNLQIKSNLMIDDGRKRILECVPGYLLRELGYRDSRVIDSLHLSRQQWNEYEMTMRCYLCGRPCAGTCQRRD